MATSCPVKTATSCSVPFEVCLKREITVLVGLYLRLDALKSANLALCSFFDALFEVELLQQKQMPRMVWDSCILVETIRQCACGKQTDQKSASSFEV